MLKIVVLIILSPILYSYYREGINIFLDGFVPTENLRFREDSLVFKVSENATEEDVKRMNRLVLELKVDDQILSMYF